MVLRPWCSSLSKRHHYIFYTLLAIFTLTHFALITNQVLAFQWSSYAEDSTSNATPNNPKPPKILVHPSNLTVLEKRSAILICEAESDPKPTFHWFKDGVQVNKKRTPIIKFPRGTVLRIEPFKNDRDGGEYECHVENGVGSAVRTQFHVKAINETEIPNGFPRFINQPFGQTVEVGGVTTITCQASGDPQPEYKWLHESVPVDMRIPNDHFTIVDGNLRISNVTETDKGDYLCIAENSKGSITSTSSVLIVSREPLPNEPPADLKYKLTSPTDVTISWSPPEIKNNATIIGYQIYFGKNGASTSNKQEIPNVHKIAFNELSENTEYTFRIRARSRGGYGQFSNALNFMTPKDSPPPPSNVRAMADSYTSAMVWWDETAYFSGITGYRVYYTLYNQTNSQSNMNEDLDRWSIRNVSLTNSVIISNLIESSQYEVRVCTIGTNFSGKLSSSVRFRALPEEVPYDLKTFDLTTHSVRLTWKAPLELVPSKYKITYDSPEKQFQDNKGTKQVISISPKTSYVTNTQATLLDLLPFTKYRINVTAVPSKETFRPPVTVHITTAMAAPKPMNEPTLKGPTPNGREYEIFLPWASEEYGPIGYYYVVVIPSDMPSQEPDTYSTQDLMTVTNTNGPYIAARFPKSRMVTKFTLGDNKNYDGFLNRPLNKEQTYHTFVRAVVEHSESLFTSSPISAPINLQPPKAESSPIESQNDTFKKVRSILFAALALVLVLAILVTMFYKKQRQALKTNQVNETTIRLLPDHMMDRIYSSVPAQPLDRRSMNYQSRAMQNHPPVPVNEFPDHIEILRMNNNLKEEYESIEPGQQFTWEHSYVDHNRPKNRYGNVVAYDHSRVVLNQIDGIPGSDYINANFCDGYQKPNQYIATQGPLPNTVGDFWRMVWEQGSRTIVMMTQLEERGRVKCVPYWPSRDSVTYHGITIFADEVEELAYYNIRSFRLQRNNEIREVRQFQFTAWPDHGVPDHPTPFLMFLRRIKVSNPPNTGPIIVLCSAGVGRTGCFIVIDSMIERIKHENTIDIYGHVTKLRAQRNYIVQTEDQYMFIHDSVMEAIIANNTEVPISKLSEHINKLMLVLPNEGATGLELEFKRLASIKNSGQKFISANLPVNKYKNRLMNILPYESTRVCLEPIAGVEGSDYINASFCDGYRQRNAYIATQSPLPDTVEDMWRMIFEHNSNIIVMLTKLKEVGREKCTQYWPAERFGDYGPFRIALNQEYDTTFNYILREFTITDTRSLGNSRVVRQFHYLDWPEQGVPKSEESFIDFIAEVHKTKQKFGIEGPITVHCSVGVGRTGVFIALSIILERLPNEGFLDLFETVRTLRTQRPGMVQTEDQYQYCYQTALEFVRKFNHYSR